MKKLFLLITILFPVFVQAQFNKVPSAVLPLSDSCYINITDTINPYNGGNTLRKLTIRRAKELFGPSIIVNGTSISSGSSATITAADPNALTVSSGLALNSGSTFDGSTAKTIINTGVLTNVAGTGISVSSAMGNVTITNAGVTSATAGVGISVSDSVGTVIFSNNSPAPINLTISGSLDFTIPDARSYNLTITGSGTGATINPPSIAAEGQTIFAISAGNADVHFSTGWGLPYPLFIEGASTQNVTITATLRYTNGIWVLLSNTLPIIKTTRVTLTSTQLRTLNSNPINFFDFPAPGTGYIWQIISASVNYSYGTTPYSFSNLYFGPISLAAIPGVYQLGTTGQFTNPDNSFLTAQQIVAGSLTSSLTNIVSNDGLGIWAESDDIGSGDGTAVIYLAAQLIKF